MIDYKVVMNVKHEGDATDLHSFQGQSPYMRAGRKDNSMNNNSSDSSNSQHSQILKGFQDEELLGETHIGFEKLLSSLFQFMARKNMRMISKSDEDYLMMSAGESATAKGPNPL